MLPRRSRLCCWNLARPIRGRCGVQKANGLAQTAFRAMTDEELIVRRYLIPVDVLNEARRLNLVPVRLGVWLLRIRA
jgi:hypothetical protein